MDAFEDLEVWKRSSAIAVNMYKTLSGCREYNIKDQIIRSVISIPSNIAEGFERNSDRQFAQYLRIVKGSCGELRSQIYFCRETGLLTEEQAGILLRETMGISRILQGLIRHCRM